MPLAQEKTIRGGLVFFEEFSGDWARTRTTTTFQNGWRFWYHGHSQVEGLSLDLVRFHTGELEWCPLPPPA
jgi:hypothetical protein